MINLPFSYRGLLFLIFTLGLKIVIAQHFQVVSSGNPYTPMNIFVSSAQLNGNWLQVADEIAVFDINGAGAQICVGRVTIVNEFLTDTNYIISATADDPTTPDIQDGFVTGHTLIFRYWDNSQNLEIILMSTSYGAGYSDVYQPWGTTLVQLEGSDFITWTGAQDTLWSNAQNWDFNRVPALTFDVFIPASPAGGRFPSVSAMDAKCRNLTTENNTLLKIHGKLTVGTESPWSE